MNKEAYVSFETAQLLKEKGFNWKVFHFYDADGHLKHREGDCYSLYNWNYPTKDEYGSQYCSAPTQQMACRWLSEVHNVDIWVRPQTGILGVKGYTPYITTYKLRTKGHMYYHEDEPDRYDSKDHFIPVPDDKGLIPAHQHHSKHEDAVEAALEYALTNLI